jgi:hypothetical protein
VNFLDDKSGSVNKVRDRLIKESINTSHRKEFRYLLTNTRPALKRPILHSMWGKSFPDEFSQTQG